MSYIRSCIMLYIMSCYMNVCSQLLGREFEYLSMLFFFSIFRLFFCFFSVRFWNVLLRICAIDVKQPQTGGHEDRRWTWGHSEETLHIKPFSFFNPSEGMTWKQPRDQRLCRTGGTSTPGVLASSRHVCAWVDFDTFFSRELHLLWHFPPAAVRPVLTPWTP